jgi:hypothetical protein
VGFAGDVERDITFVEDPRDLTDQVVDDLLVQRFHKQVAFDFPLDHARRIAEAVITNPHARIVPGTDDPDPTAMRSRFAGMVRDGASSAASGPAGLLSYDDLLPGSSRRWPRTPRARSCAGGCTSSTGSWWSTSSRTPTPCSGRSCATPSAARQRGTELVLVGRPEAGHLRLPGRRRARLPGRPRRAGDEGTEPLWTALAGDADLLRGLDAVFGAATLGHDEIRLPLDRGRAGTGPPRAGPGRRAAATRAAAPRPARRPGRCSRRTAATCRWTAPSGFVAATWPPRSCAARPSGPPRWSTAPTAGAAAPAGDIAVLVQRNKDADTGARRPRRRRASPPWSTARAACSAPPPPRTGWPCSRPSSSRRRHPGAQRGDDVVLRLVRRRRRHRRRRRVGPRARPARRVAPAAAHRGVAALFEQVQRASSCRPGCSASSAASGRSPTCATWPSCSTSTAPTTTPRRPPCSPGSGSASGAATGRPMPRRSAGGWRPTPRPCRSGPSTAARASSSRSSTCRSCGGPAGSPTTHHRCSTRDGGALHRRRRCPPGLRRARRPLRGREPGEELRLAYVALTRARHQVVVWWASTFGAHESPLGTLLFAPAPRRRARPHARRRRGPHRPRRPRPAGAGAPSPWRRPAAAPTSAGRRAGEARGARRPSLRPHDRPGLAAHLVLGAHRRSPTRSAHARPGTTSPRLDAPGARRPRPRGRAHARRHRPPQRRRRADRRRPSCGPCPRCSATPAAAPGSAPSSTPCSSTPTSPPTTSPAPAGRPRRAAPQRARRGRRRRPGRRAGRRHRDAARTARRRPAPARRRRPTGSTSSTSSCPWSAATSRRRRHRASHRRRRRPHLPADDPSPATTSTCCGPELAAEVRGYLSGSIDVVLRTGTEPGRGRYVVVDHKSNWLGVPGEELSAWHYRPAALRDAMVKAHYPLQALLYAVALHRYLRWRPARLRPGRPPGRRALPVPAGHDRRRRARVDGQPCGVFVAAAGRAGDRPVRRPRPGCGRDGMSVLDRSTSRSPTRPPGGSARSPTPPCSRRPTCTWPDPRSPRGTRTAPTASSWPSPSRSRCAPCASAASRRPRHHRRHGHRADDAAEVDLERRPLARPASCRGSTPSGLPAHRRGDRTTLPVLVAVGDDAPAQNGRCALRLGTRWRSTATGATSGPSSPTCHPGRHRSRPASTTPSCAPGSAACSPVPVVPRRSSASQPRPRCALVLGHRRRTRHGQDHHGRPVLALLHEQAAAEGRTLRVALAAPTGKAAARLHRGGARTRPPSST